MEPTLSRPGGAFAQARLAGAVALALWALAGCQREAAPAPAAAPAFTSEPAAAPAEPQAAAAPQAGPEAEAMVQAGTVGSLRLEALDAIPEPGKAAADQEQDPAEHCLDAPDSAEAKAAQPRAWAVHSQQDWAGYRVLGVSRAPSVLYGFGCVNPGGRVLVFRDGRVVAAVRDQDEARVDSGVQHFGETGPAHDGADRDLRVGDWSGSWQARLLAQDGRLSLAVLPPLDSYCGGKAQVPRLESLDLPEARKRLLAQGWRPRTVGAREGEDGIRDALVRGGYPEVEECSGTGMGYCNFLYENAAGANLTLTTGGESDPEGDRPTWPGTAGFGVQCPQ